MNDQPKWRKVWITKFWSTAGIQEAEGSPYGEDDRYWKLKDSWGVLRIGTQLHLTREGAVIAARKKRDAKICSLEKQIAKLRNLKFE